MKIKLYFLTGILLIVSSLYSYCQTKPETCNCPNSRYYHPLKARPDSIFYLANGRAIMLCGERDAGDTLANTFSDFILAVCGADTIIDYWYSETSTMLIKFQKETVLVEDIIYLPTGNDFRFKPTLFSTDKIYFQGSKVVKNLVVNRQIPKYNKQEIEKALKLFESAKSGLNDSTMEIAHILFMATVSGSHKAREYFKEFGTKFGEELDGVYAEEYANLIAMLALWDEKKY